MIKLFLGNETVFTSNGEKPLKPIKCIETKVMNEDWYLDVELSLDYVSYIVKDRIIVVTTIYGDQPFRIGNPELGRTIKFKARHIGYDLENYVVNVTTTDLTCQNALTYVFANSTPTAPYTGYSDITGNKTVSLPNQSALESIDALRVEYGGYLDFDKFQVRITSTLGADRQVTISEGKNLEKATSKPNWDSVCTKIKPIGRNGLTISGTWLTSATSYDRPYTKIVEFDTDDVTELQTLAQAYLDENDTPKVNYTVSADIFGSVFIGDTIEVKTRQFDVTTTVYAYTYNNSTERMLTVEFGNYRPTAKSVLSNALAKVEQEAVRKAWIMVDDKAGTIEAYADNQISLMVGKNNTGIISLASALWEQGGFDSTTGAAITSAARLRTIDRIPVVAGTTYYFSLYSTVEWDFMYAYFDSSGTYISGSVSWVTAKTMGTVAPSNATSIWVSLRKDAFTTITTSDLSTITFSATTEKVLSGAKYNFGADKARFYGDGQEWYNSSGVLKVYFDTGDGEYTFKGKIEAGGGAIGGWTISATQIYSGGVKLDSANERIYVGNSAYLYSYGTSVMGLSGNLRVAGTITSTGVLSAPTVGTSELIVDFGGTQYRLTRDASGFVKATTVV